MLIHATREEIIDALTYASRKYHGNIGFRNGPDFVRNDRSGTTIYRVTLTVHDSHGEGASINPYTRRHIKAACWHAHGYFYDGFNEGTLIEARGTKYRTGEPWVEYNRGSLLWPSVASNWCNCGY